jgi:hypothetical protein
LEVIRFGAPAYAGAGHSVPAADDGLPLLIQTRYHGGSFPFFMKGRVMQNQSISRKGSAFVLAALLSLTLFACGDKNAEKPAPSSAPAASSAPATPAPVTPAPVTPAAPEAATGPVVAFDIEKIPVSEKPLGEFPFFTPPEGHKYVSFGNKSYLDKNSRKEFDRYYFIVDKQTLYPVEGQTFRGRLYDEERGTWDRINALLIERNYENAITAAGGVKVFEGDRKDYKGIYDTISKTDYQRYGPPHWGGKRQTYVIRRPDAEIWVEIICDSECYLAVAQKGEMKQTVGLIPASDPQAPLDKDGHVALYRPFDEDQATIRPDSGPIVAEIVKLLEANPDLKIRIEGHTDNTGADDHNQTLSENRAASVYGTLLTKGIAQSRLQSAGFGASKPIADNATEAGKAKNRRVEIVKL